MPSRAAALAAMAAFLPHAGADYARTRNYDFGPAKRDNVSCLSPYIRHRLLTEEELVRAVLAHHGPVDAEKFIQEVFWRTYWKGWLQMRPSIWTDYQAELADMSAAHPDLDRACTGQTGIACFDAWVQELVETGYLHNHARMWFASIWIFTLGLPWQVGADFFLRHLVDGDPASNTLSWRWVAGLHTPGKTYLATPDNIRTFTAGRFDPPPLHHGPAPTAHPNPAPGRVDDAEAQPQGRILLLLTEEDLNPESLCLDGAQIVGIAALRAQTDGLSAPVAAFRDGAMDDALARAASFFGCPAAIIPDAQLIDHAAGLGVSQIVTADAALGPTHDRLRAVAAQSAAADLKLVRLRRHWDSAAWPLATKGFFAFRQHIPDLLPR